MLVWYLHVHCASAVLTFLPAAQLTSLGTLPPGAVRIIHADTTLTTSAAGEPKDLSSPREPCVDTDHMRRHVSQRSTEHTDLCMRQLVCLACDTDMYTHTHTYLIE